MSSQYVFDLMDTYGGGLGVLWVAIFESAVIMWVYGVNRFADDLGFMLNHKVILRFNSYDFQRIFKTLFFLMHVIYFCF